MIKLQEILEVKFRNFKSHVHLIDIPMFSIFIDSSLSKDYIRYMQSKTDAIRKEFDVARHEIHRLGFPSMHANVVLSNLSKIQNYNTGDVGIGGEARRGLKFMRIDISNINSKIIVHEWAHLWMFNNNKEFKSAVLLLYNRILQTAVSNMTPDQIPIKLSNSEELKIINIWENEFKNFVLFDSKYDHSISWFFLKGKSFTPDMIDFVPQGLTFFGATIKPMTFENMRGTSIEAPMGSTVYVEKGNQDWIIGFYEGKERYETVIKTKEFLELIRDQHNPQNNIIPTIAETLKKYENYKKGYKTKQTLEHILLKIQERLIYAFHRMLEECGYSQVRLDKQNSEIINNWAGQIVFPQYIKLLKSKKLFLYYYQNKNKIYDFLWVNNPLKVSSNASMLDLLKLIIQKLKFSSYTQRMTNRDLSGKEFHQDRKTMNALANWVSDYGMSNNDELWATGIEKFFDLPKNHQQAIIKLMMRMSSIK